MTTSCKPIDYHVGLLTEGVLALASATFTYSAIAAFGLSTRQRTSHRCLALIWTSNTSPPPRLPIASAVDFDALNLPASLADLASPNDGTYAAVDLLSAQLADPTLDMPRAADDYGHVIMDLC